MLTLQEQFAEAAKSHISSQLTIFNAMARETCVQVEALIGLHIATSKASLQESYFACQRLLTATNSHGFSLPAPPQIEPCIEKSGSDGQNLIDPTQETAAAPASNRPEMAPAENSTAAIEEPTAQSATETNPTAQTETTASNNAMQPVPASHAQVRQAAKIARSTKNKPGVKRK